MTGSQPLDGVTVLDLSEWIAGPNCTKQLADFGARVIKVERPDGDPARRMGPFPGDVPGDEPGGMFLHLNTNKEGVVVDLQTETGAGIVSDLSRLADIVVESFLPGTLDRLGLAPASMIAANPDLVVTSVTGFGQDGPYARWETSELVAFAMGGPMNASGNPDREPVKLAASSTLMQSGAVPRRPPPLGLTTGRSSVARASTWMWPASRPRTEAWTGGATTCSPTSTPVRSASGPQWWARVGRPPAGDSWPATANR